jgi:hypothetical protein
MKRRLMYLSAAFVAAAGLGAAQGVVKPDAPPDLMLTGCMTRGSTPTIFILDNAKHLPDDPSEKGKVYLLVANAEEGFLARQVNHEVTVTGVADDKPAPLAGKKFVEKDLPTFTAKTVALVAEKCQSRVQPPEAPVSARVVSVSSSRTPFSKSSRRRSTNRMTPRGSIT